MNNDRLKKSIDLGHRLSELRISKGLTQSEFCNEFAEFTGSLQPIQISAVSSWERNHRTPTMTTLVNLALYYNVSIDYLFGISDKKFSSNSKNTKSQSNDICNFSNLPIKESDLPKHDGLPVYVKFKNNDHLNQWGILCYNKKAVRCKDFSVSLSINVDCYSYEPPKLISARTSIVSLQHLKNTKNIWIEMLSEDPAVCAFYNGWYKHNESQEFLVKLDNNITLPYAGLDISYKAYKG